MDVRKLLLAASLCSVIACQDKKSVEQVSNHKNGNQATTCPAESMVKNRFIVKFEDGHVEVIESENAEVFERDFVEPNLHLIKRVEYDSLVTLSQPEFRTDEDPGVTDDWGPRKILADSAWSEGFYGQGVTVAVIDTAVDVTHPQLMPRLAGGWDFIQDAPPTEITNPDDYHGTHVAGIIAADPSAGSMSGVAPQANLIQASFIDQTHGSIGTAIRAIQYSAAQGARIINASWGGEDCSATLSEAITEVGQKGVLFVVASGNDGFDYDRLGSSRYQYPAVFNLANMISVAATDFADALTAFSNRSYSLVHMGAPGSEIYSTVPKIAHSSGYYRLQGTSMAAPMVSGAAALLWSAKPNATLVQIRQALLSSTDFRSYKVATQGRLNIQKALSEIRRIVP